MATLVSRPGVKPDWDALAKSLNLASAEEAERRAFEIAEFVARVEKDDDKKLVLKSGGHYMELSLKH